MHGALAVLRWLGIGLGALIGLLLAALLAALLVPWQVWLHGDAGGLRVWVRVLGLNVPLLPAAPKKPPRADKKQARRAAAAKRPAHTGKKKTRSKKTHCTAAAARPAKQLASLVAQPAAAPAASASTAAGTPAAASDVAGETAGASAAASAASSAAPAGKTAGESAPSSADSKASDHKKPPAEKPDIRRLLESLPALLGMAGRFVGAVLRALRFTDLCAVVPVHAATPDAVARGVGRANAWLAALSAALQARLRLSWRRAYIFPDYTGAYTARWELGVCVRGQLLPLAVAALYLYTGLKKQKIV